MRRLVVLLNGQRIGEVIQRNNALSFHYDGSWRGPDSPQTPLSLSMPVAGAQHGKKPVEAYLSGLLPDNPLVIEELSRRFHVSRNPFALIGCIGEDCPGAVQFAQPERVAALQADGPPEIEWLEDKQLAAQLKALRQNPAAGVVSRDHGQFSLAGAQPKTALLRHGDRWGIPLGRTPTTHILKPPTADFEGYAENEHFCMTLAHAVGLPTATTEVLRFGVEIALVVKRFDRVEATSPGNSAAPLPIQRLHQEDYCQALAVPPTQKYQADGGPGAAAIIDLLRTHSADPATDIETFVEALLFSWMTGGTDAHAKNFALLHAGRGWVRLAPLYDLSSALAYPEKADPQKLTLAMKVGGEYRLHAIGADAWRRFGRETRTGDLALRLAPALAARLVEAVARLPEQLQAQGLTHPVIGRLAAAIADRAATCGDLLRPASR